MLLLDVLGEGLNPWHVPRRRQFERNGVRGCRWVHPPCAARRPHSLVTASHPQSCTPRATTTGSPCRGSQANRGGGTRNGSYVPALGAALRLTSRLTVRRLCGSCSISFSIQDKSRTFVGRSLFGKCLSMKTVPHLTQCQYRASDRPCQSTALRLHKWDGHNAR